jgi:hypothetical protein
MQLIGQQMVDNPCSCADIADGVVRDDAAIVCFLLIAVVFLSNMM